jgi:hypothetical protein
MFSLDKHTPDDQLLIRYLLGSLPEEETERFDELSIVDDDFATRLNETENELVDAYVNGELSGDTLQSFQSNYLSSASKMEKVRFAEALHSVDDRAFAPGPVTIDPSPDLVRRKRIFGIRPRIFWSLAVAASLAFGVAGYLILQPHGHQVQNETAEQRVTIPAHGQETPAPAFAPGATKIVSVLLLAQARGASQTAEASIPPGTDSLELRLQLEFDDFPKYRAALRDPVDNQIVWRSPDLKAVSEVTNRVVPVAFPAALLKQQNYTMEVTGVPAAGPAEMVGGYPFKVVK